MPNFGKIIKGGLSALKGTQEVLPAAEREANLAKFLLPSKEKDRWYHGTGEDIKRFDPSLAYEDVNASFVTRNPNKASSFAKKKADFIEYEPQEVATGANVMPVRIQVANPFDYDNAKHRGNLKKLAETIYPDDQRIIERIDALRSKGDNWSLVEDPDVQELIKRAGHDSFYIREGGDKNLGIFEGNKIKSDIGNRGTYDVTDPDITKASGGGVHMQAGGIPKIIKAGKGAVSRLIDEMRQTNPFEAKRLERMADEVPNLENLYKEEALKGLLRGDNAKGVMTMRPQDFEKFSTKLDFDPNAPQRFLFEPEGVPPNLTQGQYIKHLSGLQGFSDVPMLEVNTTPPRLKPAPFISGHEGRHRSRALVESGQPTGIVQFLPRSELREGLPRRSREEYLKALNEELERTNRMVRPQRLNPNERARPLMQLPEVYEDGGPVHMQAGGFLRGLSALGQAAKPAAKLTQAEIAALRARGLGVRGVEFADPLAPPTMKLSEALGITGSEGKILNLTEADRSRVFGPNRGGVGFSALQHYSVPHAEANTVWGFGNKGTASKKIRQSDPENMVWSTYVGSPEQHKSNTVVVKDAIKNLQDAYKAGQVSDQQVSLMNDRLRSLMGKDEKKPLFPKDFDITDPSALESATTFDRRSAISDVLMGIGVKKPMISREFKGNYPGVKYSDAAKVEELLARETDPILVGANTFDVGPHLFTMDKTIIHRPDLNEAFPYQVTGTDLGMRFEPVPLRVAVPDWAKQHAPEGKPINAWKMSRGMPKQFVSEEYLTELQKAGYAEGGDVRQSLEDLITSGQPISVQDFIRLHGEQQMAVGGPVTNTSDTRPDVSDGGQMISAPFYAEGGSTRKQWVPNFDQGGYAFQEPLAAPDAPVPDTTTKAVHNVAAKTKEELEELYRRMRDDPKFRRDVLARTGAQAAAWRGDIANLVASGVDYLQAQVPGLRKKESVLQDENYRAPAPYRTEPVEYTAKYPTTTVTQPFTSDAIINKMKETELIGENESPLLEVVGGVLTGMAGPKVAAATAKKVGPLAQQAAKAGARGFESKVLNEMVPNVRSTYTPLTATLEATAPDLGQQTTYGYRQGLNDRLLQDAKSIFQRPNVSREGYGTYRNLEGTLETNPLLAVDIPFAGSVGEKAAVPNREFRRQMAQLGVDLNQDAMAAHRFIPLTTNNVRDASAALIKTDEGLTKQQVTDLYERLGHKMAVSHNPRLGGIVVFPYEELPKGKISRELLRAQQAAEQVLGDRAKVQFGKSDYNRDRMYIPNTDYAKEGAVPISAEQERVRRALQGQQKFLFPKNTRGIPGEVQASPIGGLQPWSRGDFYPSHVIGVGDDWQAVNFLTGEKGKRRANFADADVDRQRLLEAWHRTLPMKVR